MLKLHNISKTFHPGTVNEKKALTDLSLELNKGDFVTIPVVQSPGGAGRLCGVPIHHRHCPAAGFAQ